MIVFIVSSHFKKNKNMATGDVVYSLRFSLIKILPEPGFDFRSRAGESCVLTARLHMLF